MCTAALRILGWGHCRQKPVPPRCVLIGAPHTSNWDFMLMVAYTRMLGMKASWMGKHTLFRPPFGIFFRSLGGIPIDRTKPQGLVDQVVAEFRQRKKMILIIAPEGTRKKTPFWKTGFYYIAQKAEIPIALGSVDYPRKMVEFGPVFHPSGDIESDFEVIREFYSGKRGKYPEKMGEVRPRPNDDQSRQDC